LLYASSLARHEYHEGNLGLACTEEGLVFGRTALIERQDAKFAVRKRIEVERLLNRAHGTNLPVDRLMSGLASIATALNANDPGLARILAVHLRVPDLPDQAARDRLEAEDILIRSVGRHSAVLPALKAVPPNSSCPGDYNESSVLDAAPSIYKASPDDPKHPGWPAGTPGGRGGKFRPKDASEFSISQEVLRIVARQALRTGALAILRIAVESAAEAIPGVDIVATIALLLDMAKLISDLKQLKADADAALDFVKDGPHRLKDLQVLSNDYEEFSSYDEFYKAEIDFELLAKRFGVAGDGQQYHHIVTQGGANADNISPEQLQNTDNIIRLPRILHEAVNAKYLEPSPDANMNMYQWLQTQPYDVQLEEGLKILRDLHILR
jgi:hypothetical protein